MYMRFFSASLFLFFLSHDSHASFTEEIKNETPSVSTYSPLLKKITDKGKTHTIARLMVKHNEPARSLQFCSNSKEDGIRLSMLYPKDRQAPYTFLKHLESLGYEIPSSYLLYWQDKREELEKELRSLTTPSNDLDLSFIDLSDQLNQVQEKIQTSLKKIKSINSLDAIRKKFAQDWLAHAETAVIFTLMQMDHVKSFKILLSRDCCPQCIYLIKFYVTTINPTVLFEIISQKGYNGMDFSVSPANENYRSRSRKGMQERTIFSHQDLPDGKTPQ